jgi:hypothetical protein
LYASRTSSFAAAMHRMRQYLLSNQASNCYLQLIRLDLLKRLIIAFIDFALQNESSHIHICICILMHNGIALRALLLMESIGMVRQDDDDDSMRRRRREREGLRSGKIDAQIWF